MHSHEEVGFTTVVINFLSRQGSGRAAFHGRIGLGQAFMENHWIKHRNLCFLSQGGWSNER
jgi:hypothetical protein